jgi:hypothetical protein
VVPTEVVLGVGSVADPVPPVADVYHNNPVPIALNAVAVAPWQYVNGVVTVGNAGVALTVTDIGDLGPSQPDIV